METIDKIPITKIQRASKILKTGAKVGVNYIKFYGNKISESEEDARKKLDKANANDIYDGLKNLKGSALKVAQMLSMDKNILPKVYADTFSLSQFSVPPLSAALVLKTFKQYFGKFPNEIFNEFNPNSIHAASIGQVHQAVLDGKKLAVKIQYPGVSESIGSDLAMIKPIAMKMFNIKGKGSENYFVEVKEKLMDETDYLMEVTESLEMANACSHIECLQFPNYYKELSSERVITMDWMQGQHLSEFNQTNKSQEFSNKLGQALWDFYMFQIHQLKKFHADPHPGNFLVSEEGKLIVLDFGCIKSIPNDFYTPYFELAQKENLENQINFRAKLYELEILREKDSVEEVAFFTTMFHRLLSLFTRPFQNEYFDFSDITFFSQITELGKELSTSTELRKMNGNRGSRHFIYVNRTFFGLFNLLHDLKANNIRIDTYCPDTLRIN